MTATNIAQRIVVLIDMDCFFCQVEAKLDPTLKGKPLAVVQYTQWQSGGIIAVNYEARDHGVSRHMRAEEAKKKCPELLLATVPGIRGKPDTSRYRVAGREVVDVIRKHCNVVERASVDEAYLDITDVVEAEFSAGTHLVSDMMKSLPNTFVIGNKTVGNNDEDQRREAMEAWINMTFGELGDIQSQRLAIAGIIVERIRADIYNTTSYRCSAGISYNKILAKLACGLHKPNRQTILTPTGVASLFLTLPVKKVRNLGGKFGDVVIESLGCNVMADLLSYSLKDLQSRFDEKTGLWLYNIARGTDNEPVTSRLISKSIGCCKNFPGKLAIVTKEMLEHWAKELSSEISERLEQDSEENNRKATLLTVNYHYYKDKRVVNQSRSCRLTSTKVESIMKSFLEVVNKFSKYPMSFLGMSASKFIDIDKNQRNFKDFFKSSTTQTIPRTITSDLTTELLSHPTNDGDDIANDELETDTLQTIRTVSCETSNNKFIGPNDVHESNTSECEESKQPKSIDSVPTQQNSVSTTIKSPMSMLCDKNSKLKPDNFKKSFFMNMWNTNKCSTEGTSDVDFNGTITEDSRISNVTSEETSPTKPDVNVTTNVSKKNTPEPAPSSTSRTDECDTNSDVIKLTDIFPDLNNIDESVVALLPSSLRDEANALLTNNRQNTTKLKLNPVKSQQQSSKEPKQSTSKSAKSKCVAKIEKFFNNEPKQCVPNSRKVSGPTEKCKDCGKLIPLEDYLEHVDYHVAQNLSKEINQFLPRSPINMKDQKPSSNDKSSKRKRNKNEMNVPPKKSKNIAAFFS